MSRDYDDRDDDRYDDDYDRGGRMAPHRGTMILLLGILSLVICAPLGIAAWIMGKNDLAAMEAGRMDPTGRDQTNIGYILGIVGSILFVIQMIAVCAWLALFGAVIGAGGGGGG
ncbi:MAG: DUF4190 domain-containing protein [Planctomycetia bacterium]|nr:DUF4190 domain-containing protein [Planctomycetia bacterium]